MSTEWRTPTKYIVAVGLALFGLYVIYLMRPVISLLVLAALIAFLANPLIRLLHRQLKLPRGVAVLITYLLASLLILALPLILIPQIVNAANFLLNLDYAELINNARLWLENTLVELRENDIRVLGIEIVVDSIVDPILIAVRNASPGVSPAPPSLSDLFSSLGQALTTSLGIVVGFAGSVAAGIASFLLLILSSIYISLDAHKLRELILDNLPPAYRPEIDSLLNRLSFTWSNFLKGQLALMLLIGLVVWIGGTILGLPGAFFLGIISGLLELLPNLGPALALIPAIIVALTQGSTSLAVSNLVFTLIVIAFYLAVQQFENVIVVPRLMSRAVKLHPLVVIVGVFVGAISFGILGAVLAAPVIASTREIIQYLYSKISGLPPEEPAATEPAPPEPVREAQVSAPPETEELPASEDALLETPED